MDHNGEIERFGPLYLLPERFVLNLQRGFVPMQVETNFTNGYVVASGGVKRFVNGLQFFLPSTGLDVARVQSHHTETALRPFIHHGVNPFDGFTIDVGQ